MEAPTRDEPTDAPDASRLYAVVTRKSKRDPFADRKAPFEHFSLKNLFLQGVHAVAFTAVPILAAATPTEPPESDDDDLLDWAKLDEEMKDFKMKCAKMFLRVVGGTSLKRGLEMVAIRCCQTKMASRFVKDPAKSALRKYMRSGRLTASVLMVRTAAYANVLAYTANLLIEELTIIWQHLTSDRRDLRQLRRDLLQKTRHVVIAHGTAFVFSTLGIAVGTLLKPGYGTVIGGAFGDLGGLLLI